RGEREDPEEREGEPVERRPGVDHLVRQDEQQRGHQHEQGDRPPVAAQLEEYAPGGRDDDPRRHGGVPAVSVSRTSRRNASSISPAPVALRSASGESSATMRPSRISSSRSQRSASSITWLETNSVVPVAARVWK